MPMRNCDSSASSICDITDNIHFASHHKAGTNLLRHIHREMSPFIASRSQEVPINNENGKSKFGKLIFNIKYFQIRYVFLKSPTYRVLKTDPKYCKNIHKTFHSTPATMAAVNEVTEETGLMESVELVRDEDGKMSTQQPPGHVPTSVKLKSSEPVTTSVFKNEGRIALFWLIFTMTYWTILIWVPTIINLSFETEGLTLWCIGAIGMMSCAYTLYEKKYPSGATADDPFETRSIGRWTAALLTTTVITDVCCIVFYTAINEDAIDVWVAVRLGLHMVHIFWASLFFYNKFYSFHYKMATRAFFIEWTDIIWSAVICYTLNETLKVNGGEKGPVNYIYFVFVLLALSGWMLPMMLLTKWVCCFLRFC